MTYVRSVSKMAFHCIFSEIIRSIGQKIPEPRGPFGHNLDLFGESDNIVWNGALRAAGLFLSSTYQLIQNENRLTLDAKTAGAAGVLSVFQG
ncbi:hypothetical protein PHLCEN_2v10015 [Hermanssonia centrifuga]|uniref:Uncharacterized protein n=1 Tax=Hermanssonia centrifuga TaxID=98765 RepID=A0A2R6NP57_9APHY|nr:hypothetical protein PHLCEN_2v10015 [Hermanssonia centrifuga]